MPDAASALPDDVASLKAMVLAQTVELVEIRAQRQAQETELAAARAGLIEQRFEIEALKSRLARLQRMTFERSSESKRLVAAVGSRGQWRLPAARCGRETPPGTCLGAMGGR